MHFSGDVLTGARVGIVPQDDACVPGLTVWENVLLLANFSRGADVAQALRQMGLYDARGQVARTLSAGQKRRLTIAMVLVTRPSLLVLDEVTVGLGRAMKRQVWDAVLGLRGCAIMAVTHDMHEIEALADQCSILSGGRILRSAAARDVMGGGSYSYVLTLLGGGRLAGAAGAAEARRGAASVYLFQKGRGAGEILRLLRDGGRGVDQFVLESVDMESVFLETVSGRFVV